MDGFELTPLIDETFTIPDAEEAAPVVQQPAPARVFDVGERPDRILTKYADLSKATVAIEDYNLSVNKKVHNRALIEPTITPSRTHQIKPFNGHSLLPHITSLR